VTWYVTLPGDDYGETYDRFEWDLPEDYNVAHDFLRKHDDPRGSIALLQGYPDGRRETYSFRDVDVRTDRIARGLRELGVGEGDRVAIVVPQKPANLFTHLACWKLGAVSVPLSVLFGPDAIRYRLDDCDATVVVADGSVLDTVADVRGDCPALDHVVGVDPDHGGPADLTVDELTAGQPRGFDIADTTPDTPATLMYTSGSTGPPKGVLHSQGIWVGQCPAYAMYYGQGDVEANLLDHFVVYGHADWAWIGTLGFTAFPAWHYGRPIVGFPQGGFDPELSFEILEEFGVTHAMFVPTAMRMVMASGVDPADYDLDLEAIMSGSEPVTPEIMAWVEESFDGVTLNETYGQTEVTVPIGNCAAWFEPRPGSIGKPVPGSEVALLDPETGDPVDDEVGELHLRRDPDHPGIFEEYWNKPEETESARRDGWHRTGDLARRDADGYYWYESRVDDLIITSGYRVSPNEVESAVLEHRAVQQAGVVGVPDDERGEVIVAFVKADIDDETTLESEVQDLVRERMAAYAYPRRVEVVDDLPQTVTGKIKRRDLREREIERRAG